jgi:hypothetical protein
MPHPQLLYPQEYDLVPIWQEFELQDGYGKPCPHAGSNTRPSSPQQVDIPTTLSQMLIHHTVPEMPSACYANLSNTVRMLRCNFLQAFWWDFLLWHMVLSHIVPHTVFFNAHLHGVCEINSPMWLVAPSLTTVAWVFPKPVQLGSVMDKVALEKNFLRVLQFYRFNINPPMLHIHMCKCKDSILIFESFANDSIYRVIINDWITRSYL